MTTGGAGKDPKLLVSEGADLGSVNAEGPENGIVISKRGRKQRPSTTKFDERPASRIT